MKPENKTSWTTLAIIVLALMNLATIATVIYNRQKMTGDTVAPYTSDSLTGNPSVRFTGRYFRDQLNLDKEQMLIFRDFNAKFRQQVRDINIALNDKRHSMLEEMAAPESDSARLDALSDSIGYLHADLKKLTSRYYIDFKKICDKSQQQKLEQLFGEMFATDNQTGHQGRRGPNGNRRGKRFLNK